MTKAPFQITETGWGEFEAGIRIYFKDSSEQPVDLFHHLRLYPPNSAHQLNPKKPVVSENYDEIVFASPYPKFHSMLMLYGVSSKSTAAAIAAAAASSSNNNPNNSNSNSNNTLISANNAAVTTAWPEHYLAFDDAMDMEMLLSIQQHIQREVFEAKKKVLEMDAQVVDALQAYSGPAPANHTSSSKTSNSTKASKQQAGQTKNSASKKDATNSNSNNNGNNGNGSDNNGNNIVAKEEHSGGDTSATHDPTTTTSTITNHTDNNNSHKVGDSTNSNNNSNNNAMDVDEVDDEQKAETLSAAV